MKSAQVDISARLSLLMDEQGVTNYRLSKELPCAATSIANWLNGKPPTTPAIVRLSEYFGVTVEYLKGETDEREQKETPAAQGGELDGLSDMERAVIEAYRASAEARARMDFEVEQYKKSRAQN